MKLNKAILKTATKQEIVDTFNNYSLLNKINIVGEFSNLLEVLEDKKGNYYLRSLGHNIFAKQYKRIVFNSTYGWTKNIEFYYIKDDLEKEEDNKINILING